MDNIFRILYIGLCTLTSLLLAQYAWTADDRALPEIDRLAPEHVERATFSLG